MKKTIIVALLAIILMSCTAVKPVTIETPVPTITQAITPLPAITATPTSLSWQWSNALVTFNGLAVLSGSEVWAIGQRGIVIHDRPRIMHLTSSYDYPGEYNFGGGGYLSAIDFISESDGWITGWAGQIFHWDGKNWIKNVPGGVDNPILTDIDFANSTKGWVAGCYRNADNDSAVLMQWNGNSWENVSLPEAALFDYCLSDIDVVSDDDVWVVGNKYQDGIILHWDGSVWKEFPASSLRGGIAVAAVSTGQVWVLGGDGIYYWNGSQWIQAEMPVYFWFSENDSARPSILAIAKDNVWVGGQSLYHWNGSEWENKDYNESLGYIVDIEADPDGEVWALTLYGAILHLSEK